MTMERKLEKFIKILKIIAKFIRKEKEEKRLFTFLKEKEKKRKEKKRKYFS